MKTLAKEKPKAAASGRDEMNLCEFPFGTLTKRRLQGTTSLTYSDEVWDGGLGQKIKRTWTIEASQRYGLPTSLEDEVVLGLIQLTWKQNGFENPRVFFTRRELLEQLGWGTQGSDYKRLEKAFHCIKTTSILCERAWRDNKQKAYVSHKGMSVISDFELVDSRKAEGDEQTEFEFGEEQQPRSYAHWGSEMFKSFRDGFLKQLDYDFVCSLEHPASKRLYRYLDKKLNPKRGFGTLSIDLFELAYERLGVSRKANKSQVERIVVPAVTELEARGFLRKEAWESRCTKVRPKVYEVSFSVVKRSGKGEPVLPTPTTEVEADLVALGVSADKARKLASAHSESEIRLQLEHLAFLVDSGNGPKEPGGWLYSAIAGGWSTPKGFVTAAERAKKTARIAKKKKERDEAVRQVEEREAAKFRAREEQVRKRLAELTPDDQEALFEQAIAAGGMLAERYRKCVRDGNEASAADYRQMIFEKHMLDDAA